MRNFNNLIKKLKSRQKHLANQRLIDQLNKRQALEKVRELQELKKKIARLERANIKGTY